MDLSKLSREALEDVVHHQERTMYVLVSWYIKAVERHDKTVFTPEAYLKLKDNLIDVAVKDAQSFIEYENRLHVIANPEAERAENNLTEAKVKRIIQGGA